jgi:hypothetical protein
MWRTLLFGSGRWFLTLIVTISIQISRASYLKEKIISCPRELTNAVELSDVLKLFWDVKVDAIAKKNKLRVCMKSKSEGWLGFGISPTGQMTGAEAVIGVPDDGTVLKYDLNGKSSSAVVPMNSINQTLMNTSIKQKDGDTVLYFEKYLHEDQYPIVLGRNNTFIFADATSSSLQYHGSSRGNFTLFVEKSRVPTAQPTRKRSREKKPKSSKSTPGKSGKPDNAVGKSIKVGKSSK